MPYFPLDFNLLSVQNKRRCESPNGFNHPLQSWSPSQWSNAMAGETGEACNLTKKLDRIADGLVSVNKPDERETIVLLLKLKKEIGDVVIYADLLAQACGLTLEECVRTAFNDKSDEIGSPFKV